MIAAIELLLSKAIPITSPPVWADLMLREGNISSRSGTIRSTIGRCFTAINDESANYGKDQKGISHIFPD